MNKERILQLIIERLDSDLEILTKAAKAAHAAATHEENVPDSKYETLALEASYIAQGQANRAQQIRQALESYRSLSLQTFSTDSPIRLTALVRLEDEDGSAKQVFIGPAAGGLKLAGEEGEITVITPASPLGRQLLGREAGDLVELSLGSGEREFEIIEVC